MKTKIFLSVFLAFAIIVSLMPTLALTAKAAGVWDGTKSSSLSGSGTSSDPFEISSGSDLSYMAQQVNAGGTIAYSGGTLTASSAYYELMGDIVLNDNASSYASWGTTAPTRSWMPISTSANNFSGTFDGANHTVSGIYINSSADYQGLFGFINGGIVKNVLTTNCYISGGSNVGCLAGFNTGSGTVQNCCNTDSIVGGSSYYIGGIVGFNNAMIANCYNTGSFTGSGSDVGGITGYVDSAGTVQYCYNMGTVTGSAVVGGVVGENGNVTQHCYNVGIVTGSSDVVGMGGGVSAAVGGIVGFSLDGTLRYCYNAGNISDSATINGVGCVVGVIADGTITGCYYDKQMCAVKGINGYDQNGSAEGKSTSDMATATEFSAWNGGGTVWTFSDGLYPRLAGMDATDAAYVSASPVSLAASDTAASVKSGFTVGTANSVNWSSGNTGIVSVSGGSAAVLSSGSVTLTATLGAVSKAVAMTTIYTPAYSVSGTVFSGSTGYSVLNGLTIKLYASTDTAYSRPLYTTTTGSGVAFSLNVANGTYVAVVAAKSGKYAVSPSAVFTVSGAAVTGANITLQNEVADTTIYPIYVITMGATQTSNYHVYKQTDSASGFAVFSGSNANTDSNTTYSTISGAMNDITADVASGSATLCFGLTGTSSSSATGILSLGSSGCIDLGSSGSYNITGSVTSSMVNSTGGTIVFSGIALTICSGAFIDNTGVGSNTIYCGDGGNIAVTGGTVQATGANSRAIVLRGDEITVSGGTVQGIGSVSTAIENSAVGDITISGGKIYSTNYYTIKNTGSGDLSISGSEWNDAGKTGTLVSSGNTETNNIYSISDSSSKGAVTVSGGTITSPGICLRTSGELTVSGGSIVSTASAALVLFGTTSRISGGTISASNSTGITADTISFAGAISSGLGKSDAKLYISGGSITNAAAGCPAVYNYNPNSTHTSNIYLSGTPVISGTPSIWSNTVVYASDGAASPTNYTGGALTLQYGGTITSSTTVAVSNVSSGINNSKFSLTNSGYSLNLSGSDLIISTSAGSSGSTSGGGSTPSTSNSASIDIGGKAQSAGTVATTTQDGKTTTTVTLDSSKLDSILSSSVSGTTVTIPITTGSDAAVGSLTGQAVKAMENKDATLVIKTGSASYTLPASEIAIDSVSSQFGEKVSLSDIKVSVAISTPSDNTAKIVANAATSGGFSIAVPAVEFTVTCTYGTKTVEVSSFNSYVKRLIAIPSGVDASKITTAIVVETDGSVHHVPTEITVIDGKYYAKVNSLTNSVYSLIYNPITFSDVENHWAKDAVNDMGSRLVVNGVGSNNYEPDRSMTRAEFAAVVVRALGLEPGTGTNSFGDVATADWFCKYIETASSYGIIKGYDASTFGPNDTITREQAMTMISRAMKITELTVSLTDSDISGLLAAYTDSASISNYAKESTAACVKTGIVSGMGASTISPKSFVSRAEVAVMADRLLKKSGLI